jgi:hypothetical protein
MELESLMSRYFRLKQELLIAYRARPWQSARIDRLADDLAATERDIGAMQAANHGSMRGMARGAQHGQA